jgi:hypothetical protein
MFGLIADPLALKDLGKLHISHEIYHSISSCVERAQGSSLFSKYSESPRVGSSQDPLKHQKKEKFIRKQKLN